MPATDDSPSVETDAYGVVSPPHEPSPLTEPPVESVRPKLFVDVDVNFGELIAATTQAKTDAEKRDADAKVKAALLTMHGDINGTIDGEQTRLQHAAVLDDPDLIAQLIKRGANPNQGDDAGMVCLMARKDTVERHRRQVGTCLMLLLEKQNLISSISLKIYVWKADNLSMYSMAFRSTADLLYHVRQVR